MRVSDTPIRSTTLKGRRPLSFWTLLASAAALLVCLPIISVAVLALFPSENIWQHLYQTVLPGYIRTTLILMIAVALGTSIIGISCAWLVTHYEFPGRTLFTWALLLPFAVPAYVLAYVYTDLLEYAGPVQSALRDWFNWQSKREYYFPAIRSLGGAASMLILVLYPYVYLLARSAFVEQSSSMLEAVQVLGRSRVSRLFQVALPMARPAIVIGVSLALMETLNDYGTVSYFAVNTLSLGIYDVWLGMGNLGGAAQLAVTLIVIVLILLSIERHSRRKQMVFQPTTSRLQNFRRTRLNSWQALAVSVFCAIPVVFGFAVPMIILLRYAFVYFEQSWTPEFQSAAWHSVSLSITAALVAMSIGTFLSYCLRLGKNRDKKLQKIVSIATLGYALPGVVLAIGIIVPLGWLDNTIDGFFRRHFDYSTGLLLSGTVFALVFAYTTRFLAIAFGAVDTSLKKIPPSMDEAARCLRQGPFKILRDIHLPMMKGGLLTGTLVVFVDCMKELPATLIMRPFNYETLATQVYHYASDELIEQSALGALLIVVAGLLPVILLSRSIDRLRS